MHSQTLYCHLHGGGIAPDFGVRSVEGLRGDAKRVSNITFADLLLQR